MALDEGRCPHGTMTATVRERRETRKEEDPVQRSVFFWRDAMVMPGFGRLDWLHYTVHIRVYVVTGHNQLRE